MAICSIARVAGMEILGWAAVTAGTVLFVASLIVTVRANTGTRIPFFRNPRIIPPGSIMMRSIGAGLLVLGSVGLSSTYGYWAVLIAFAGVAAAMVVIPAHNLSLPRGQG